MGYKLLALDVDGTLLNSRSELTERTTRAIQDAQKSGMIVCLVSGRRARGVAGFAADLSLTGPIIACNGGAVVDVRSLAPLHTVTIQRSLVAPVLAAWEAAGISFCAYRSTANPPDIYYCHPTDWEPEAVWIEAEGKNAVRVSSVLKETDWEPLRLMFGHSDAKTDYAMQLAEPLLEKEKVRIYRSLHYNGTSYYEIYPRAATKSSGLRFLESYYGLTRDEIVAVGDGLNDLDMLDYAGLGVAMGNADQRLKEQAQLVIGDHNDDGLAKFIERLCSGVLFT